MDNTAMFKLSYGLFVATAREGSKDNGCITNTVMQVTTAPNCITLALNKGNYTHDMILHTGQFNISVLSEQASFDIFRHWGFQSGRDVDKSLGVELARSENGIVYLTGGVNAVISAKVTTTVDLGTHTLFIAEVTDALSLNGDASATYAYYHKNIKPAAKKPVKKGWICTVCGYIYEGEVLPPDFICPVCKHPASDFKALE